MDRFIPADHSIVHLFPSPDGTGASPVALAMYLFQRDGICWVKGCTCTIPTRPHHAVIRRSDVQGWQPRERRCVIDTPYVLVNLCVEHHETALEPSREEVADWMLAHYGSDVIRYYCWLPFKVHPLRGWLARSGY